MEQEISTLDELVQSITNISKAIFDEVMNNSNVESDSVFEVAVEKAVNHIINFDDEPFTDEIIKGMVTDALLSQSVYGYANLYADDFGDYSLDNLAKNLRGSHYLQMVEEVSTATLGDYSHNCGGLAGNAFYDPKANKKHKSNAPKIDYITEEVQLKNIIRKLIENM